MAHPLDTVGAVKVELPAVPLDPGGALRVHQNGRGDPTVQREPGGWWWATHTPTGPGTLHLTWSAAGVDAEAWGAGAEWLLAQVPELLGELDEPVAFTAGHAQVLAAQHRHPGHRIGRSRRLFHTLVPVVIAQRVTAGEAMKSWRQLCLAAGEPAPGPRPMRLPPRPEALVRQPYWWFHRFGIERKRADAIRELARHAARLDPIDAAGDVVEARRVLSLVNGIGPWTIGMSLGPALGDPDSVAVGDYWIPHAVCWALAGEPRGSDERMLELLEPYAGQRGRAVSLLFADGWRAPRFGPGIRVMPIAAW